MRILVATHETQGERPGDFCRTVDGELVRLPLLECNCPACAEECGCSRSFAGLSSRRTTTTAIVAERPDLDEDEYHTLLFDDAIACGLDPETPHLAESVGTEWDLLCGIAQRHPVGTVIDRSSRGCAVRRLRPAPA